MSEGPAPVFSNSRNDWGHIWLAAVLLFGGLLGYFKIYEPDVFWHLKTGQIILETGRLVRTNLYSASYPDHPWHNLEWLHQVILAYIYNGFGWKGIAVLKMVLILATAFLLYLVLMNRASVAPFAAAVTLVAIVAMRFRLTERPHIFSHLFFVVTILVVEHSRRRGGLAIWFLPPLFALWSNFHPEFTLALAYLAAGLAGDWCDTRLGKPVREGILSQHAGAFTLSTLATLANPETFRPFLAVLPLAIDFSAAGSIREFRRSTPADDLPFWILTAAVIGLLAFVKKHRRLSDVFPLLVLATISAVYVRTESYFVLAAAPVLQEHLAALSASGGRRRHCVTAGIAAAAAGAVLWAVLFDRRMPYHWGFGPDEGLVPEAATQFILTNDLPGNVYNSYNEGGYLIFRIFPRRGVFQDGRVAIPREVKTALDDAFGDREAFQRLLDGHQVVTALVNRSELSFFPGAAEWGVVFWDDRYTVLVRRKPETSSLLARLEYRSFLPGTPVRIDQDDAVQRTLLEMRRNREERALPNWRLELDMGKILMLLGDADGAEREILKATTMAPREPEAWSHLASLRTLQGRSTEAAAAAAKAQELRGSWLRAMRAYFAS